MAKPNKYRVRKNKLFWS